MWEEEQFDELEQEEHEITEEEILLLLAILALLHENLENELQTFYQRYGTDGVVTYAEAKKWTSNKDHRKRLTVLLLSINTMFDELLSNLSSNFRGLLEKVINKETHFFDTDVDVEKLLNTTWGVDDALWTDRLTYDVNLWNANVTADIKRSLIKRDNIQDVLEDLDKRFTSMEYVIKRLALTESTAMGSLARYSIFSELGVKKYQFFAREDERTCEECGALHGKIFPISAYEVGVTASPIHAHCRCWEVPIME